jgi:hypothetical protein
MARNPRGVLPFVSAAALMQRAPQPMFIDDFSNYRSKTDSPDHLNARGRKYDLLAGEMVMGYRPAAKATGA